MVNYRFYVLGRNERILEAHVGECKSEESIRERSLSLMADREDAMAVEAWQRDKMVLRTERNALAS